MAVIVAMLAVPASAGATVTSASVGLPGTGVALQANFGYSGKDSVKDITVQLPPGYVIDNADTTGVCTTSLALSNKCPASSVVPVSYSPVLAYIANPSANIPNQYGYSAPSGITYATAPSSGELAHFVIPLTSMSTEFGNIIFGFVNYNLSWTSTAVQISEVLRTTPTVGVNLSFTGIPYGNGQVEMTALNLYFNNGLSPSTCGTATGSMSFDTYASSAPQSAALTQPGCSTPHFGFAPSLAVSATPDSGDTGAAGTAVLSQDLGGLPSTTNNVPVNSNLAAATVTFPATFAANAATIGGANPSGCALATLTSCRVVGTLTAQTPMTTVAPTGNVYLVSHGGTTASLVAVMGQPFSGLQLTGSATALSSGQLQISFSGLPDVPLSTLALTLNGGVSGLLQQTATTGCSATATSVLGAQDMASVTQAASVSLNGTVPPCNQPNAPTFTPSSGPAGGGTQVAISGTGFEAGDTVTFGSTPATSVTVNSPTSITAVVPPGSGSVSVNVIAPGGSPTQTATSDYTYVPAPVVTGVTSSGGYVNGGEVVTITGTNLLDASAVNFGAVPALISVPTATSITATVPAGTAGVVDVTVTTPGGTSAVGPADQFTYLADPTLTSVSPASGNWMGGYTVTVTGTNLQYVTSYSDANGSLQTVTMTTTPTSASFVMQPSPWIPNISPICWAMVLGYVGGTTNSVQFCFNALPPAISSVTPASGPDAGGTTVTIAGSNFAPDTTVSFGSVPATSTTVNSRTSLTAVAPPQIDGTVDVTATDSAGTSAVNAGDRYAYGNFPVITGLSPAAGRTTGGTAVTITGSSFQPGSTVKFGNAAATGVVVNSPTSISAVSPAGAAGDVDVTVTDSVGTSALVPADQFAYGTPPSISFMTPGSGPVAGGTKVTIFGGGFVVGGDQVYFGTVGPITPVYVGTTILQVTAPPHAKGQVPVTVNHISGGGPSAITGGTYFTYS
jgi:hypothetical protein